MPTLRLSIINIVFRKELREMLRDRRSLAIMFGIPLVLYPALTIIISTVGMSKQKELQERPARVAVINVASAPRLIEMMSEPQSVIAITPSNDYKADLAADRIDAVLTVPQNAEQAALAAKDPQFQVQLDRSRTNSMAAENKINKLLDRYQQWIIERRLAARGQPATELLQPIKRTVTDVATGEQRFGKLFGLALPVLLLMTGMLGALFPALNATTTERELGTLETLLVTPAGRMELLIAKGALVLISGLLTAALNMLSMSLVLWRVLSAEAGPLSNFQISPANLFFAYLAGVPTLITFATLVLIVGLLARNFREANSLATPIMMIPLASMLVGVMEPKMSPGLLVTPVANTTVIIREVLTGRMTAGPFFIAFISSCAYAGLFLSLAARVFTNEQLVNPSWEPVTLKGLRLRTGEGRRRMPGIDEALGLFAAALLLVFYIAPSLQRMPFALMLLIQQVGLIAGPALLLAWLGKYRWRETFSWRRTSVLALVAAAMLGVGLAPWMQLIGLIQAKFWRPDLEHSIELLRRIVPLIERFPILLPLLIGVSAGVCEETLFRGPIQNGLLRKMPKWTAILLASLLFAAAHLDLFGLPIRMFLGVVLGWMVVHTGSIYPAMVMHAAYDIAQLLTVSVEVRRHGVPKVIDMATSTQSADANLPMLGIGAVLIVVSSVILRRQRAGHLSGQPGSGTLASGDSPTKPPAAAYSTPPPTS